MQNKFMNNVSVTVHLIIRGYQYSWFLQNAFIHRLLNSSSQTLEVENQGKSFIIVMKYTKISTSSIVILSL